MYRTLIVEDSAFYRQLLKEALHSRFPKMDITEAMDGRRLYKKSRPTSLISSLWISNCPEKAALS